MGADLTGSWTVRAATSGAAAGQHLADAGWCGAGAPAGPGARCRVFPASVISPSSSAVSSSRPPVSCPSSGSAWSRMTWASARFSIHHFWSSVASSGWMTGSVSRCQPSRHCAARSVLARSAHAGHIEARVCPHGTSTCSMAPVATSVRRSCTGRCRRRARRPGRGRPRGPAASQSRSARVVFFVLVWVTSHPVQIAVGEGQGVAAQAAFGVHAVQSFEQEQARTAQRARFVGTPGQAWRGAAHCSSWQTPGQSVHSGVSATCGFHAASRSPAGSGGSQGLPRLRAALTESRAVSPWAVAESR